MKVLIVVLLLIGLTAVGGYWFGIKNADNNKIETVQPTSPTPLSSVVPTLDSSWKTCRNEGKNFTINYPRDWATLPTSRPDNCQLFDPSAANLSADTAKVVVKYALDQKSFTDFKTTTQKSNEEQLILNNRQIDINGQSVDRIETESTGIGSTSKGIVTVYYFFNTNPLVVITGIAKDRSNLSASAALFDQIAASIVF